MIKYVTFGVCLVSMLLNSCAKDDNKPSKSLPPNTLQLTVQGKVFNVNPALTTFKVYKPNNVEGGYFAIFAASPNTNESVTIGAINYNRNISIEAPGEFNSGPGLMIASATYLFFDANAGHQFQSINCRVNYQPFTLKIESVDMDNHSMTGSFSGDLCRGLDPVVKIENGKFNLPYTVEP